VPRSKNEWSYTSTAQYASMAWCSVKAQGQLYLYLLTQEMHDAYILRKLKYLRMEKALNINMKHPYESSRDSNELRRTLW
jgi:hypothetical protein